MRKTRGQVLSLVKSALDAPNAAAISNNQASFVVTAAQRDELVRWARASTTPQRVVTRSVIVLLAGAGWRETRIANELGVTRRTVALWRGRFARSGARALLVDAPGRGRKPGRDAAIIARIKAMSQQAPPTGHRWTVRSLARAVGVSHATVQRVWREHQINPASAALRLPDTNEQQPPTGSRS